MSWCWENIDQNTHVRMQEWAHSIFSKKSSNMIRESLIKAFPFAMQLSIRVGSIRFGIEKHTKVTETENGHYPNNHKKFHSPIVWMFFNRLFKPIFDPIATFCKRRCTKATIARKLKLFPIILFRKWFKLFMGY